MPTGSLLVALPRLPRSRGTPFSLKTARGPNNTQFTTEDVLPQLPEDPIASFLSLIRIAHPEVSPSGSRSSRISPGFGPQMNGANACFRGAGQVPSRANFSDTPTIWPS